MDCLIDRLTDYFIIYLLAESRTAIRELKGLEKLVDMIGKKVGIKSI